MSRRTAAMSSSQSSNSGVAASGDGGEFGSPAGAPVLQHAHPQIAGQEKQKMLLSSETGHFSLVRLVFECPVGIKIRCSFKFRAGRCILLIW
jgi:CDP-diacylglycerol--serine O-phosphatidyltransferase